MAKRVFNCPSCGFRFTSNKRQHEPSCPSCKSLCSFPADFDKIIKDDSLKKTKKIEDKKVLDDLKNNDEKEKKIKPDTEKHSEENRSENNKRTEIIGEPEIESGDPTGDNTPPDEGEQERDERSEEEREGWLW